MDDNNYKPWLYMGVETASGGYNYPRIAGGHSPNGDTSVAGGMLLDPIPNLSVSFSTRKELAVSLTNAKIGGNVNILLHRGNRKVHGSGSKIFTIFE